MEAKSAAQRDPAEAGGAGLRIDSAPGIERATAELRAALLMARRFPRNEAGALAKVMRACERPALAQEAIYALRRARQLSLSPSLRLARVIAQAWGNLQLGTRELVRDRERAQVEAFCWDLESNVREVRVFDVSYRPRGKAQVSHEESRRPYESVAAAGARRQRACILALIPQDVVEAALSRCEATLAELDAEIPLPNRVTSTIERLKQEHHVSREAVEALLGYPIDQAGEAALVRLRAVLKALRDGFARREDFFPAASEPRRGGTGLRAPAPRKALGKNTARGTRAAKPGVQIITPAPGPESGAGGPDSTVRAAD